MGVDGLLGKTNFSHYTLLPQRITIIKDVFRQKSEDLGVPVYRPDKAIGMREISKASSVEDVVFENGQSIAAQYVIGPDGS